MKTKLLCLLLLAILPLVGYSQEKETPTRMLENGVYLIPEKLPQFPGGFDSLMKFLSQNTKYPVSAQQKEISGRVIVQFVVEADGTISRSKIIRGVDPDLDAEALRVVKSMPKWIPGENDGKKVAAQFTVPIMFNLMKDNNPTRFKSIILPIGQEVKNKSLLGIWQICKVEESEGKYKMLPMPILKIISSEGTFRNVISESGSPAMIVLEGDFKQTSDSTYTETFRKSFFPNQKVGTVNVISFQFLNDNLMKIRFHIDGIEKEFTEYWVRVSVPEVKLISENS